MVEIPAGKLDHLAKVLGVDPEEVPDRLDAATVEREEAVALVDGS